MKAIDTLLGGFRWYRRWRGGIWERYYANLLQGFEGWNRNWTGRRPSFERVTWTEDYATLRPARSPLRRTFPRSRFALAASIGCAMRMKDQPGRWACGDSTHIHCDSKSANACIEAADAKRGYRRAIKVTGPE